MAKNSLPSKSLLAKLKVPAIFASGMLLAALLGWDWKTDLLKLKKQGGFKESTAIFPREAKVSSVIDGDTVYLDNGQTVRLLGINAPGRGETGYEQAKSFLTRTVDNEQVTLEYDAYQDDKFGRLLAYIWESCKTEPGCQNGKRMLNVLMLKEGLAKLETYDDRRPLKYKVMLEAAARN